MIKLVDFIPFEQTFKTEYAKKKNKKNEFNVVRKFLTFLLEIIVMRMS